MTNWLIVILGFKKNEKKQADPSKKLKQEKKFLPCLTEMRTKSMGRQVDFSSLLGSLAAKGPSKDRWPVVVR